MNFRRTELQLETDRADLELFRVISRLEALAARLPESREKLTAVVMKLRLCRPELRAMMHEKDRQVTDGK